jgi:hypothetical protein
LGWAPTALAGFHRLLHIRFVGSDVLRGLYGSVRRYVGRFNTVLTGGVATGKPKPREAKQSDECERSKFLHLETSKLKKEYRMVVLCLHRDVTA